jgi:elongation factor 1-alpha
MAQIKTDLQKNIEHHINLSVVGHVDHGKSTLVGHLLLLTGAISEYDIEKNKREAEKTDKASFQFAFCTDSLAEERKRGITIDTSHKEFQTTNKHFTIVDCPGHKNFVKNTIVGIAQSDVAIIVVAANDGVMEQTKEHTALLKTSNIKKIIVAINKMDVVEYSEITYNQKVDEMKAELKSAGFAKLLSSGDVFFIPISGYEGVNVRDKPTDVLQWYTGLTLVDLLDGIEIIEDNTPKPFVMPVANVSTIEGIGIIPTGQIISGICRKGMKVLIKPGNISAEIKSIQAHHREHTEAHKGLNVGLSLRGVQKNEIRKGDVIVEDTKDPALKVPKGVKEFTALTAIRNHPTALYELSDAVLHINTIAVTCKVKKILSIRTPDKVIYDVEKGIGIANDDGQRLGIANGQYGLVVFECLRRPVVISPDSELLELSKFAIRDSNSTIGQGICKSVVKIDSEL